MRLIETHPGGGQYDCLTLLADENGQWKHLVHLNRNGSIHASGAGISCSWLDAFTAPGGHDIVRRLEGQTGIGKPTSTPPTGPHVLAYRIIARVLTALVDDRRSWDARNGQIDSSGYGGGRRPELEQFPTVITALGESRADDAFGLAEYRFWILLRDEEPLAVLDTDGHLHVRTAPPTALLPVYRRCGRSLTLTIAETLGAYLP